MSEIYQEYANQQRESLDVQPDDGLIRGVKILGLVSRNGRIYPESVLKDSIPLYEGAKVNINHALDGRLNAARDYRDRIGSIEHVQFKPNQGLFADFRFNPKHPQAPQLIWDAQNAPTNVGFSHCVEATTNRDAEKLIIERIHRVLSVDLVADPATTNGLFEQQNAETEVKAEIKAEANAEANAETEVKAEAGEPTKNASDLPLLTYQPTESKPAEPTELEPVSTAESFQNRLTTLEAAIEKLDRLSSQLSELTRLVETRIPGFTSGRPVCSASSWQQTTESERPATTDEFLRLIRG